jgi:hypothetical protein
VRESLTPPHPAYQSGDSSHNPLRRNNERHSHADSQWLSELVPRCRTLALEVRLPP